MPQDIRCFLEDSDGEFPLGDIVWVVAGYFVRKDGLILVHSDTLGPPDDTGDARDCWVFNRTVMTYEIFMSVIATVKEWRLK